MAIRGIYATVNGQRKMYPCAEIDLDAIALQGSLGVLSATSYTGGTPAQFLTVRNLQVNNYISETLTDPRTDNQIVYFAHDNLADCFESVELSAEPDNFFIHGIESPSTPRNVNPCYYTGILDANTGRYTFYLSQNAFSAGTYFYNNTCCRVVQTDENYSFGLAFNAVYSPASGFNYYQFDAWFLWYNTIYGLDEGQFNLQIQYGLQTPRLDVAQSNRTYQIWNNIDMSGSNPPTPNNFICGFCVGEYNGETYVGWVYHYIDENGNPTGNMSFDMFPLWFWGEDALQPYTDPEPVIPEPQDYGADSWAEGGGGTLQDTNTPPELQENEQLLGGNLSQAYGMHIYRVSASNYNTVMQALYGTGSEWNALWNRWQNYKFNPISGIISSHYIPYVLCDAPPSMYSANVRMCGTAIQDTESLVMNSVQIKTTIIGSIDIPEFFGNAFDYSPYTQMKLFLPFCGWLDIDPDRVTGGKMTVKYKTDCATGDICAYVICTDRTGANTFMYTKTGNCAVSFPIAGNEQGTGSVLGGLMSATTGLITGNAIGVVGGIAGAMTAKHHQQTAGGFSGSNALVSDRQCRLQIIRPVLSIPKYGQLLRGRPSDVGITILQLVGTGFNSFSAVHADIENATADECREIETLLQNGVIL